MNPDHDDAIPATSQWPGGFTRLDVRPDMEANPWTDLNPGEVRHGYIERVGLLRAGTVQGRASVALVARLDDGQLVVVETTWRLFHTAARALAASPIAAEEV